MYPLEKIPETLELKIGTDVAVLEEKAVEDYK